MLSFVMLSVDEDAAVAGRLKIHGGGLGRRGGVDCDTQASRQRAFIALGIGDGRGNRV